MLLEIYLTIACSIAICAANYYWKHRHNTQVTLPALRRKKNLKLPPGTLFRDGNTVTSKTETSIRTQLKKRGLHLLPAGVCFKTYPDPYGKPHVYTPDIIIWGAKKRKIILEIDPKYTHDKDKWYDDTLRAYCFTQLGFVVIRLRLDGAKKLTPNDLCFPHNQLTPRDIDRVVRRIETAKLLSLNTLRRQVKNLKPKSK